MQYGSSSSRRPLPAAELPARGGTIAARHTDKSTVLYLGYCMLWTLRRSPPDGYCTGVHMTNPSTAPRTHSRARRPATPVRPRTLERPAPLREAVYDAIIEMIISRELQPGEHLAESELAAQLGVSRQPVREALQRLEGDGWVDLRPALGASVHVPTDAEADELLAVRTLLEAESARLAARNATPEDVERLWELQRSGVKALQANDQEGLVAANADLHAYVVSVSGNKALGDLI